MSELASLQRDERVKKRQVFRARDAIVQLIQAHPQPLAEHVLRAETELAEALRFLTAYETTHDELLDYCVPEGETDAAKIAEATRKLEDKWLSDSAEVGSVYKDMVVKVQLYREKYEGNKCRESLNAPASPIRGQAALIDPQSLVFSEHRLKPLEVPKFDGDPRKFMEFKELFENLIHNNRELANVQKMHRLKEALIGDAAEIARAFRLQDKAYPEAWAYLVLWYENQRGIIGSYLKDLFAIPPIKDRSGIRKLVMDLDAVIRNLVSCGVNAEQWSVLLSYYLRSKLDEKTKLDWDNSVTDRSCYPSYESLKEFLINRSHVFDDYLDQKVTPKPAGNPPKASQPKKSFTTNVSTDKTVAGKSQSSSTKRSCRVCKKGNHLLIRCNDFLAKTPHQRYQLIKAAGLCLNCFSDNHSSNDCTRSSCKECQRKHHNLLHFQSDSKELEKEKSAAPTPTATQTSPSPSKDGEGKTCAAITRANKFIVLPTAVVRYRCGKSVGEARILLDPASQSTAIADTFVDRKHLVTYRNQEKIGGVGGQIVSNRGCKIKLLSRYSSFDIDIDCDVMPATCMQYQTPESVLSNIQASFSTVKLAESNIGYSSVDIILGGEYYERCIINQTIESDTLTLRNTHFGWTVAGPVELPRDMSVCMTSYCYSSIRDIDRQLRRFIDSEESSKMEDDATARSACEAHFKETYSRMDDGRFIVCLPTTDKVKNLDNRSRWQATRALLRSECKLNVELRQYYVDFMQEYRSMGHMSLVPDSELEVKPCYYIPHLIVLKPDSTTTKARVVFNASAKIPGGPSLNDALLIGPVLQPQLFDILVKFRIHNIAFSADIAKMYRQVLIHEADRPLQRIVWRDTIDGPVETYQLNTVTYGTASASFLATKCLDVLAESVAQEKPEVAQTIRSCFYMDDLLAGADTVEAAIQLQQEVHSILASGQFPLRKYISNSPKLLATLEPNLLEMLQEHLFDQSEVASILGLVWMPKEDALRIKFTGEMLDPDIVITKRILLSLTSKIFDPLGVLAPFIIRFKMLLQSLWKEHLEWDAPVPQSIVEPFRSMIQELPRVNEFVLRRVYSTLENVSHRELFGFCDASTHAYSAVVYLRSRSDIGCCQSIIVCAKTRVAPIKPTTIHRLELLAAQLLSKLIVRIASNLGIGLEKVFCFSDSQVTLCWLSKSPESWQVYVANRVRDIQMSLPIGHWAYISTKENPADLPSCGITMDKLLSSPIWLYGPQILANPAPFESWNSSLSANIDSSQMEARQVKLCHTASKNQPTASLFDRFSSFTRMRAVVAWFFRFICNARNTVNRTSGSLSVDEYTRAEQALILYAQRLAYPVELATIAKGELLPRRSPLFTLQPILDSNGILRITGRINNALVPYEKRHPAILPANSRFVQLLVEHIHRKYFHANIGFIKAFLVNRFWIVGGANSVIKRILHRCVGCARYHARTATQVMSQLPIERSTFTRPFCNVGLDYCGPFDTKCVRHRSTIHYHIYLCVFVCMATRAIHLEVVSDLTSDKFLDTFNRFASRRGVPCMMYSDNAKTFVAAAKVLAKESIQWKFITPRAPHHGGLWEAAVKAAKSHLLRVTKGNRRTYEEYVSLFSRIEAILNSRPLCYRRSDSQDATVLTPGHFLTGSHLLISVCDPGSTGTLHSKWIAHQQTLQLFWHTWCRDYLNDLQVRSKWHSVQPNFQVGDIVVVKDESLNRIGYWNLGKIEQTFPDKDGIVRSVSVRVNDKEYTRPVTRIVRLPIDNQ